MEVNTNVDVDIDVLCNEANQDELRYIAQSALDFLGEYESGLVIEDNLDKASSEALIEELEKRNYEIKEQ